MAKLPEYFHFRILYGRTEIGIQDVSDHDFVEVVRCRDCIQYVPDSCFCRMADWTTKDEDFCSWAVKRMKADGT